MPPQKYPGVSVIGAGTVGSTLSRSLFDTGYPIVSIISRTGTSAINLAKTVKCKKASTQVADVALESEIILIATPDGDISEVTKQLATVRDLKFKKLFVVHTSGVHSAALLEPLRKKGATVASIHPIQTFPARQRQAELKSKLKGIFYGIDGETQAIVKAERLVHDLGGKPVVITKEIKPLYHVACVFASGYMMVVLNAISELAKQLKLKASWTEVFGPLMTTAMENSIHHSVAETLTGPILRKDMSTIELHLTVLSRYAPQFLPLYIVSGIEVARIAKEHGRISQVDFDDIIVRFRKFVKKTPIKKTRR